MCGIIGIVGDKPVSGRLIESLKRLEYRGYDSAGVAGFVAGRTERRRAKGKISALETVLAEVPLTASTGIGHTRWATHGKPSEANAHPHAYGRVTVVHNGIIENFAELKQELAGKGHEFSSDTDTEVFAHLVDQYLTEGLQPLEAFKTALGRLTGAYALAVMIEGDEGHLYGARKGSPLVVGHGDGEMFIGSDALAVGPFTNRVSYLDEGDFVAIDKNSARIFDASGKPANRPMRTVAASAALVEKGNYRHFMEKEIHDQPEAILNSLSAFVDPVAGKAAATGVDFAALERVQIVACGTAYIAGLIGKYLFEQLADLPVDVEIASEFRYRTPAVRPGTLAVAISQSGETADTLAALRWCADKGLATAAIVNAHESTMAREAGVMWPTRAGPEIGVASTKAFTAQVAVLTSLAIAAAAARGKIDAAQEAQLVRTLTEAPRLVAASIALEPQIHKIAQEIARARDVLYLGRGPMYAMALEGALKLKEISYIHAEGYAAGELKHGPIALVDENVPVIVIAPCDSFF
jgi:glucosamine--fructose-6-phosphate aminotransferase (isomerizing)